MQDQTGGNAEEVTRYSYANPAYHYDDEPAVKAKYRTYGQFRGYQSVTTLTGDGTGDGQDKSVTIYYQGMYGDYLTSTTTSTTTVADSFGDAHPDYDTLAGQPLEQDVYLGDSTTLDRSTIDDYWVSNPTGSQTFPGLPTVTAQMSEPAETLTQTMTTDGGVIGWDFQETDDSYDTTTTDQDFGLLLDAYTHAWSSANPSGTDADDSGTDYAHCTTYTYAPANTGENLVGLVATEQEVSVPCTGFTEGSPVRVPSGTFALSAPSFSQSQVVAASAYFYDQNGSFTTTFAPQTSAPSVGDVTETASATGYSGTAFSYQMEAEATYDGYGRVLASTQTTSQTLDPTRGLVLTSTDANGIVTTDQYDALGRLTSEWDDSRYSSTTGVPANEVDLYTESNTGLSGTVTETMDDQEQSALSVTILDSLGRTRQTQSSTADNGLLVTDTFYNSLGQVSQVNNGWWDKTATPSTTLTLAGVAQSQIPNWDQYSYDGLGNQVEDQQMTTAPRRWTPRTPSTPATRPPGSRTPPRSARSPAESSRPCRTTRAAAPRPPWSTPPPRPRPP